LTKPYFINFPNEDDLNERRPQNIKSEISQQPLYQLGLTRGKLEENSEEISSVALLSPTCIDILSVMYVLVT
jgi:hypothetical protein